MSILYVIFTGPSQQNQSTWHFFFNPYYHILYLQKKGAFKRPPSLHVILTDPQVLAIYQATFDRDFPEGGMVPGTWLHSCRERMDAGWVDFPPKKTWQKLMEKKNKRWLVVTKFTNMDGWRCKVGGWLDLEKMIRRQWLDLVRLDEWWESKVINATRPPGNSRHCEGRLLTLKNPLTRPWISWGLWHLGVYHWISMKDVGFSSPNHPPKHHSHWWRSGMWCHHGQDELRFFNL